MPREETHQALVLRSVDYKDRQRIITIFTEDRGLLSFIIKGISRKNPHLIALTTPLMHAEFHLRAQRSELYAFVDATPLTSHNTLRTSLPHLNAAGTMLRALIRSQLPGKPSPNLFHLTLAYLRKLPSFAEPAALTSSYLLKLLKHEGYRVPLNNQELLEARDFNSLRNLTVSSDHNQKIYDYLMNEINK